MLNAFVQSLPLVVIFLIGYLLKRAGLMSQADGSSLLKLVFNVGAPALIVVSITRVQFEASFWWLLALAPITVAVTLGVTFALRRTLLQAVDRKSFGTIIVGASVMNLGFLIPFVEQIYGAEGLARLLIIDALNAFITYSVIYSIAVAMGNDKPDHSFVIRKLLISPPLWALLIAITFKLAGLMPPTVVMDVAGILAQLTAPAILIALGLLFRLKVVNPRLVAIPLLLRFGVGLMVGVALVKLFGLQGVSADVALLACLAPVGFNSVTFSEMEQLNTDLAVSQVSAALLIAFALVPIVVSVV